MALDLAINELGDLRIAPNHDLDVVTGQATVDQRIRVRLRVYGGEWELDPSGGELGSHLHDALRLPRWRAEEVIPMMVREALEPMSDIQVRDVQVAPDEISPTSLNVTILYVMADDSGGIEPDALTTTLTIEG